MFILLLLIALYCANVSSNYVSAFECKDATNMLLLVISTEYGWITLLCQCMCKLISACLTFCTASTEIIALIRSHIHLLLSFLSLFLSG